MDFDSNFNFSKIADEINGRRKDVSSINVNESYFLSVCLRLFCTMISSKDKGAALWVFEDDPNGMPQYDGAINY